MQFWQQYHYLLLATVADAWRVMSTEDERALRWNRLVPLQISVCCEKATAFAYTAIFMRLLNKWSYNCCCEKGVFSQWCQVTK